MNEEKYNKSLKLSDELHNLESENNDEDHVDSDMLMTNLEGWKASIENGDEDYCEDDLDEFIDDIKNGIRDWKLLEDLFD